MKKLLLLFLVGTLFVSCSKDEVLELGIFSGEITNSDLAGVWNVTEHYTTNGKIDTNINGVDVRADFTSQGKNFETTVAFSQNPNTVLSSGAYTNSTSVRYSTFSQSEETTQNIPLAGLWTLNNNVLTVTSGGISSAYLIVQFTGNTLQLKYRVSGNMEIISGISGNVNATYYISLQK